MAKNPVHVMIDLETMGVLPTSAILTIGAANLAEPEAWPFQYYGKVNPNTAYYHEPGVFSECKQTAKWWLEQPEAIRNEAFSGVRDLDDVLQEFVVWLQDMSSGAPLVVWAKSAAFDLAILRYAFFVCGIKLPWSYKNERDYRTLVALYPNVPYMQAGETLHTAIGDCVAQAKHLNAIVKLNKLHLK